MINTETQRSNWPLILSLGALALIRPIARMTGLIYLIGGEGLGSIILTVLISIAWLTIVIRRNVYHPIRTLILAGVCYAVFSLIIGGIFSTTTFGELQGPLAFRYAIVSVLLTNAIWGLILGVIAWFIIMKRRVVD
jgi:hypothetical protein